MTIQLPEDMERSINEAVISGRFASMDAAMTEAARLLLQRLKQTPMPAKPTSSGDADPFLGLMRDDTELMDEIVADAYRHRREDKWREFDL
jgi:Arc/MetJ-type ribon-helix-helix transcriptional regulator